MPIDPAALNHFMGWEGPVGRSIKRRIDTFEVLARTNAPIRAEDPGPHLAESIDHTTEYEGNALLSRIGTNPHERIRGYAIIVHRGSRPHVILPHKPPQSLKFRVGGRIVYAQRVHHPGTVPDPFLTRWMKELTR